MSEGEFIAAMKNEMTNNLLRNTLEIGMSYAPEREAQDLYRYQNEKRTVKAIIIPDSDIKDIGKDTDEVLKPLYEAAKEKYAIPETRNFTMAVLNEDLVKNDITVSDDDVQDAYDRDKSLYALPDRMYLSQAVLDDEGKAKKIAQEVSDGKSLKDAVKAVTGSEDAYTAPDEYEQDGLPQEFADVVFKAGDGNIVGPVKTALGYHVVHVLEKRPARTKALDEVRDQIHQQLYDAQVADHLLAMANNLDDRLASGMGLDEAINDIGIKPKMETFGPVRADGSSPDDKDGFKGYDDDRAALLKTAFELFEGEISPVSELAGGRYAVIRVDKINDKTS